MCCLGGLRGRLGLCRAGEGVSLGLSQNGGRGECTFSRRSWSLASQASSSSVGFAGMLAAVENWE